MKRMNLTLLAVAGLLAAAPVAVAIAQTPAGPVAVAQNDHRGPGDREHGDRGRGDWGDRDHGPRRMDLRGRIDWMQRRIDRGREDGSLDRGEAFRVQSQLDNIRHEMRRMERRNGGYLSGRDRAYLEDRLDRLNSQMRWLRRNDEARPW